MKKVAAVIAGSGISDAANTSQKGFQGRNNVIIKKI